MAITNNLNFGNPRKPDIYFQLREAVAGMAEACAALGTPVTGGNVSLYNETPRGAIYPTPVVGMVGCIDTLAHITRASFAEAGDHVVLLGEPTASIGASEYLQTIHGVVAGAPPACDPAAERRLVDALLDAIAAGHVRSAHDCADGGLAVALAECAIMDRERPLAARVDLNHWAGLTLRALLFGEAQGRVIVSTAHADRVLACARRHGVSARAIGVVHGGPDLEIAAGGHTFAVSIARLADAYFESIPRLMSQAASAVSDSPVTTAV